MTNPAQFTIVTAVSLFQHALKNGRCSPCQAHHCVHNLHKNQMTQEQIQPVEQTLSAKEELTLRAGKLNCL